MLARTLMSALMITGMTGCATAQTAPEETPTIPGWLAKDFVEFVDTFEGRWDSDRHVFFAEQAGMNLSEIAPRQHIEIRRIALTAEETAPNTAVFEAVRTVANEAPATLIHTLYIDAESQTLRQSIAAPGGVLPPVALGCEFVWARDSAQFRGEAVGDACADLFPRPAGEAPLNVTLSRSVDEFWVTAERGDQRSQARLRRARDFECWTAVLRGASHGDSGEGMRDWDFRRGVKLHDQGGEAELITDEDPPRRVRLRLRNVDWPYGTNRPSLTLYVLEGESDRAVSYAWNEGDADRIGINLRWLQASCTLEEEPSED